MLSMYSDKKEAMKIAEEILASFPAIKGASLDSRNIKQGWAFLAIDGINKDGCDFALDAQNKGALCIVSRKKISNIKIKNYIASSTQVIDMVFGMLCSKIYPKRIRHTICITGTNGKSSAAYILYKSLIELNKRACYIGTLGQYPSKIAKYFERSAFHTTPDPQALYSGIDAIANDFDFLILETSSHALSRYRIYDLNPCIGIITNCTFDHLRSHNSIEGYISAKAMLFSEFMDSSGTAIINQDILPDTYHQLLEKSATKNIISYSIKNDSDADIKALECLESNNARVKICILDKEWEMQAINKVFDISNYNISIAVACMYAMKIDIESIMRIAKIDVGVPGRLNVYQKAPNQIVVVDFAHNASSTYGIIAACIKKYKNHSITCVFGCGGQRDQDKREPISKITYALADKVIITDDNARHEDPLHIRNQLHKFAPSAAVIGDRKQAITAAITTMKSMEVLLILGRGNEKVIDYGNRTIEFSDADFVENYISTHRNNHRYE